MSKVELELVLASPGPFVPGQTIEGFVGMTVNTSCNCRGLTVVLEWFTHGRGNRKTQTVESQTVFEGALVEGAKGLHPFSLTVPPGPFSYDGQIVSVGWRVRVNADLPWAFDPKTETTVTVVPGSEPLAAVEHGSADLSRLGRSQVADVMVMVLGSLFWTVAMGMLAPIVAVSFMACLANPGPSTGFAALVSSVIGAVFTAVAWHLLRPPVIRLIAARRVSGLVLTAPEQASPGETLDLRLELTPRRDLLAEEVRFELRMSEVAVSGSGTRKTTHRHDETVALVVVGQARTLQAKRPATFTGQLTVPETTGISFAAPQNSVTYRLAAVVDCPGVFDPEADAAVTIVPATLSRGR